MEMASDARLAKLLGHIAACRNATLPGRRRPFCIGPHHVGYVTPEFANRLAGHPAIQLANERVTLAADAVGELNTIARAAGCRQRNEDFDVRAAVDGPVLGVLDRGALPDFGIIGVGVHMNGLVHREDGLHLWVGTRARDKKLDPGKLDHLVAGGVPAGYSRLETLIKEGLEEASLPEEATNTATEVARFDYAMERPEGLRRDVVFAYDVLLPEAFTPRPTDDEVESFALWPLAQVLDRVAATEDFKFNVNLVLIDLFIRHGLIVGEAAATLRAALPIVDGAVSPPT